MNRKEIINSMKNIIELVDIEKNHEVFGYFLYGSQNYKLDDEISDIDMCCLIVPTYDELLFGYSYSSNKAIPNSKNRIATKTTTNFFKGIESGNFTNIELLFSPYVIINEKYIEEWEKLKEMRFSLLQGNPVGTISSMVGQAKAYLGKAQKYEKEAIPNGKFVANYLRLISSIEKYREKKFEYLYELSPTESVVLKSIKRNPSIFKIKEKTINKDMYEDAATTTVISKQIREKNRKNLVTIFQDIVEKGNQEK